MGHILEWMQSERNLLNCNIILENSYNLQHTVKKINIFIFWDKEFKHHCTTESGKLLFRGFFRN